MRILICEDEPDIARILALTLANEGDESDIAPNAAQAKTRLRERNYGAMTLDLMLPDENGLVLLRDLRASPVTRNLPVVVVSAWAAQMKDELAGHAVNVKAWVSMPLDLKELLRAVRLAGSRQPRREE